MFSEYLLKFGLSLLHIIARAPPNIGIKIGKLLGEILFLIAKKRRTITKVNLKVCFPCITEETLNRLAKQCFRDTGIGIVETSWAWHREIEFFKPKFRVIGLNNIESSVNRGILLTCGHHSMLDIIAPILFSIVGRFVISYRPNENKILNREIMKGRKRYADLVNVRSLRILIRKLNSGNLIWFGPDQDMGPRGSVFVPFFNHTTCTITTPSRLVEITGAKAVHLEITRIKETYEISFKNYPHNFPTGNIHKDAITVNQHLENAIRQAPSQYLWMHKRFKTEPNGGRDQLYQNVS